MNLNKFHAWLSQTDSDRRKRQTTDDGDKVTVREGEGDRESK